MEILPTWTTLIGNWFMIEDIRRDGCTSVMLDANLIYYLGTHSIQKLKLIGWETKAYIFGSIFMKLTYVWLLLTPTWCYCLCGCAFIKKGFQWRIFFLVKIRLNKTQLVRKASLCSFLLKAVSFFCFWDFRESKIAFPKFFS